MKLVLGLILGFVIGALCQLFHVPAPAPPLIEGALLVVAMTLGYGLVDKLIDKPCETEQECGGPSGQVSHSTQGENHD